MKKQFLDKKRVGYVCYGSSVNEVLKEFID